MKPGEIKHFSSQVPFRKWLEVHHATASELVLGFYKKSSDKNGITYAEALDEALCFGWIDGIRRSVDEVSYSIRFTPRKARSIWSKVNLAHIKGLKAGGRMMPAGLKAHTARDPARSGIYAFENAARSLAPGDDLNFRANKKAWKFFEAQAPSYKRTAIWWIVTARKDETRARRLALLIDDSASGRKLAHYTWSKSKRAD